MTALCFYPLRLPDTQTVPGKAVQKRILPAPAFTDAVRFGHESGKAEPPEVEKPSSVEHRADHVHDHDHDHDDDHNDMPPAREIQWHPNPLIRFFQSIWEFARETALYTWLTIKSMLTSKTWTHAHTTEAETDSPKPRPS